jgi:hypothetical protein
LDGTKGAMPTCDHSKVLEGMIGSYIGGKVHDAKAENAARREGRALLCRDSEYA